MSVFIFEYKLANATTRRTISSHTQTNQELDQSRCQTVVHSQSNRTQLQL